MPGIWASAVSAVEKTIPIQERELWIRPITLVSEDEDRIVVRAPDSFHRSMVVERYLPQLRAEARSLRHHDVDIECEVDPVSDAPIPTPPPPPAAPPSSGRTSSAPPPGGPAARYTFDAFVAGRGNELAYTAARRVAENPGSWVNPILIYGESGLGKTHLLHAIWHEIVRTRPDWKICYVSCERFMNDYITSINTHREAAFRKHYREEPDVLLVDDVQILAHREGTQNEFFHTFNAIHEAHKQIVLTADRPATEIPDIPERLRSRFEWGLTADILPPDYETRVAIVCRKATLERIDLEDGVAELLASTFRRNVREIEGALTGLAARASLYEGAHRITVGFAQQALGDLIDRASEPVTIEKIIQRVAEYYQVKAADIRGPRRHTQITQPRAVAMYLSHRLTGLSLPVIGTGFGGRHHTTVLAARDKITEAIKHDRSLRNVVEAIQRQIEG